jgi:hypothetical protein
MKRAFKPELAQAINRQAHMLAAQSFASIRMALEEKARELMRAGTSPDETLRAIRLAGMQREEMEP